MSRSARAFGCRPCSGRPWGFVVVVLASVLLTSMALGAPREEAVKLANRGFDLMERGEFGDAADLFEEAAKLYYSPVIALYWARAEAKSGKLVEARAVVTTIESHVLPDGAKPTWAKAMDDASIFGVELDGRIPTVVVNIDGDAEATVRLDDAPIAVGQAMQVNPGKHVVVATDAQGDERTERFTLTEKEAHSVTIRFAAAVEPEGPTPSLVPPIIAYSVAGVGLVIGAVTGILFIGKASDLDESCPNEICAPENSELLDETKTLGNVATVGWVIAGIGAAVGTVLLFVPLSGDEGPVVTVEASPVSASLRVRF